jgi:8-oxo-dGTP diphosphatase
MSTNRFNIRVYGLLINRNSEILLSDEYRNGTSFTKFPGGGLEFGEGLHEAVIREFQEELGIHISVEKLFYVNEFFQPSAFSKQDQLLSFYYLVKTHELDNIPIENHTFPLTSEGEKFRWVPIQNLNMEQITFPIDKVVGTLLKKSYYSYSGY